MSERGHHYSFIIAVYPDEVAKSNAGSTAATPLAVDGLVDWRLGDITVDWVDFTREKSFDKDMQPSATSSSSSSQPVHPRKKQGAAPRYVPGSGQPSPSASRAARIGEHAHDASPSAQSLQPLLAHVPNGYASASGNASEPTPLSSPSATGVTHVGRGIVHLFKHAPPATLISKLEGQSGEDSRDAGEWSGERAEGADGSLIAILAVPAWMRPADFLEFIGGWAMGLEGVRMIRSLTLSEATMPNRSIVLLKFRDPLQAADFMVIFTGRAFSTLDARETCHPIRVHHLVLHKAEGGGSLSVPAFPPTVYASRASAKDKAEQVDREAQLDKLLPGTSASAGARYELPSCPVCLERLDSTVTGLVTLPCAHTFDCDCLRKWGDSRCPVCRVSHLLLSGGAGDDSGSSSAQPHAASRATMRGTQCAMCSSTENNWMCVVCGVVGCGRYSPGKAHARQHWEESGHVLAMELDTQRVWDYEGDNYVHRLIRTRTDGKLVELPSASSLATPAARTLPLNRPLTPPHGSRVASPSGAASSPETPRAGPSSTDIDKMSTIESITLEYSYLLSSQLESMRQHYESRLVSPSSSSAAAAAQSAVARLEASVAALQGQLDELSSRVHTSERARDQAEHAREKAERRADKATGLARALQGQLADESAMSRGLKERTDELASRLSEADKERHTWAVEKAEMEETVKDLMMTLEMGQKLREVGEEGGDLVVVPNATKKKGKGARR